MLSRSARLALRASKRSLRQTPDFLTGNPEFPRHSSSSSPKASRHNLSTWDAATESAHSVLTPLPSSSPPYDPLSSIYAEIGDLKSSLFRLLGSNHPSLDTVAKYYFRAEGKHLRPLIVLLMSQATNSLGGSGWDVAQREAGRRNVDDSLTSEGGVLNDWNPDMMGKEDGSMVFAEPFRIPKSPPSPLRSPPFPGLSHSSSSSGPKILPTQRRLASVTEMIHVASLLHDDVIDTSPLRRGAPSAPNAFGNKLSILSGDFLLGRASVALARLGSSEVVELMATVIANLVEGEVLQLRATSEPETQPTRKGFEEYMRKTYLKTASLMAKSARSSVVLGGCGLGVLGTGEWVKDVAYGYGRNLGIAFQVSEVETMLLPDTRSLLESLQRVRSSTPSLSSCLNPVLAETSWLTLAYRRRPRFPASLIHPRQALFRRGSTPRPGHRPRPIRMGTEPFAWPADPA